MAQRTGLVDSLFTAVPPMPICREAEKPGSRPAGAGHGEGDLGQARVGLAVPGKPLSQHYDPLQVAIPLACQQGARPQFGSGPVEVSQQPVNPIRRSRRNPVKQTPTVGIQVTEPIDLQSIGEDTKQKVAGQVRGWTPPEDGMPSGSQLSDIETAQTRDLVVERPL